MSIIKSLAAFLKEKRDEIVKRVRYNVVRERTGYSEYTQWDTTVSFDEIETVDFDALMEQIETFEKSFQEGGENYKRTITTRKNG